MKHKPVFLLLTTLFFSCNSQAQGFFNQKKAMIKKALEQIALLNTYTSQLRSGYKIVEDGVQLTHTLKNGEFDLHSLFYTSLEQVNPDIKRYPPAKQTVELYNKMTQARIATHNEVTGSGLFSEQERQYIQGIYTNLFKAADADLQELTDLLTDGKLRLTDAERMKRINGVHRHMLKKFKALRALNGHIRTVLNGRKEQQHLAHDLKGLYGIP